MQTKRLVLRLSSLGDIILATSVLEVVSFKNDSQVDWVIGQEYAELLRTHPGIHRIFEFNRQLGLQGWIDLCRKVWLEDYDVIYDLHVSLRTRILFLLFFYWSLKEKKALPQWKSVSKQRWRLTFYFLFKSLWPFSWKPQPWVMRYSQVAGGSGQERPHLVHLIGKKSTFPSELEVFLRSNPSHPSKYLCVMPSSLWNGKKWPVQAYFELLKNLPVIPVVLGTSKDKESFELVQLLESEKRVYFSGVGKWDLTVTATILSRSLGYLGGDTGLAHLAESVGVPAQVIFGPTVPDMGFGPWRKESQSFGISLGCRPCSKDGRRCYRVWDSYACLKSLPPEMILQKWRKPSY